MHVAARSIALGHDESKTPYFIVWGGLLFLTAVEVVLAYKQVFTPLHMTTVFNTDLAPLRPEDPSRYLRYALGPLRPAPKAGSGLVTAHLQRQASADPGRRLRRCWGR